MRIFLLFLMLASFHPLSADDCDPRALDRERLQALITSRQIKSIREVIASLPACYRESNVKIYHSSSLQCATPKAPRIVLYLNEPKGNTRCAFNSGNRADYKELYDRDPSLDCHENSLECEHFTGGDEAKFEFYEVKAPNDDKGKPYLPKQVHRSPIAQISSVNPATCMTACHRGLSAPGVAPDPRPTIEKYPLWAGFYGSYHDELFKGHGIPQEKENFAQRYLPYKKINPRYSALIEIVDSQLNRKERTHGASGKPTVDLQNTLEAQNYQRIARKFTSPAALARLWPFRYAILGALSCNDDVPTTDPSGKERTDTERFPIESFLPEKMRARFGTSYQSVASAALAAHQSNFQHQVERQRPLGPLAPEIVEELGMDMKNDPNKPVGTYRVQHANEFYDMTRLAYLAKNLDLSIDDWALTFRNTLDFEAGRHNPHQILPFLFPKLLDKDKDRDLAGLSRDWGVVDVEKCRLLRRKSLDTLEAALKAERISLHQGKRPASGDGSASQATGQDGARSCANLPRTPGGLSECIRCHVHGDEEYFPFDDPSRLSRRLRLPVNSRKQRPLIREVEAQIRSGKMPYSLALAPKEKEALIRYFEALNASSCPADGEAARPRGAITQNISHRP